MQVELAPSRRLAGTLVGFGLLYAASPGIVTPAGEGWLAAAALAFWARYASATGQRAGWIEWATASLAWAGICSWTWHVWGGNLAILGPGHGVYMALHGWALRRFARRLPLALAAPLAWLLFETIRAQLPPPFGLPWMRLGTHLHDQLWISGSARVWGTGGLSWVIAAFGGMLADLASARWGPAGSATAKSRVSWTVLVAGLAPLATGVVLARVVPAPATVAGPRVLLVQPALEQVRKMEPRSAWDDFRESVEWTQRGLREARAAGEPEPDLIAWGETMLRAFVIDPALPAAMEAGARFDPWQGDVDVARVLELDAQQKEWVDGLLLGAGAYRGQAIVPAGTAFLTGAEYLTARAGRVRRKNSVFLWNRTGERPRGPASKRHLVPGAETMLGLEHNEGVRKVIRKLAGYVPDLISGADDDPVLEFDCRDGRRFALAVSVCFDNAFDDAYTEPLRSADVDFHLVASNEAWFKQSQEVDQMVAFSRLAAIATGRAVVRATNSGIGIVIAPDGRELGRIRSGGNDREVAGTLRVTVPVPTGGSSPLYELDPSEPRQPRATTPFVRWEYAWIALWILVPLSLLAWLFKSTRPSAPAHGRLPRAPER